MLDRHSAANQRQDYHAALVCAVLANINRDPKRRPRAFTPQDFMWQLESPTGPAPADEDHLDDMLALGASMGAEVIVNRSSN